MKGKDIVESKFLISHSESFIHCNKDSSCEHIPGGVNIYLYGCVSLLTPWLCCVSLCVCMFVSVIRSQSTSKKPHYVSDLSKPDTLLHKTHQIPSGTKVPKLIMCRSLISFNEIAYQSPIQPKKEDNRKSTGSGGWKWQGKGKGCWTKLKKGVGNKGGFVGIEGLRPIGINRGVRQYRGARTHLLTMLYTILEGEGSRASHTKTHFQTLPTSDLHWPATEMKITIILHVYVFFRQLIQTVFFFHCFNFFLEKS